MLTFKLNINDKHSTNNLLRPKNLRFSSRTNLIKARCQIWRNYLRQFQFEFYEFKKVKLSETRAEKILNRFDLSKELKNGLLKREKLIETE